jgi:hypothetical protein
MNADDRWSLIFAFLMSAMSAITRDHGDLSTPAAFLNVLLQTKELGHFDPWVTQRFPLGHPEISTGSPKGLDPSPSLKTPNAATRNDRLRRLSIYCSKRKANMSKRIRRVIDVPVPYI